VVPTRRIERRAHLRVAIKVALKLVARDEGNEFKSEIVTTENISAGGFLCACTTPLLKDTIVEVYLSGQEDRYVGKARVARKEVSTVPWQNYGFQFVAKTEDWLLQ
jgi:PilZ domain